MLRARDQWPLGDRPALGATRSARLADVSNRIAGTPSAPNAGLVPEARVWPELELAYAEAERDFEGCATGPAFTGRNCNFVGAPGEGDGFSSRLIAHDQLGVIDDVIVKPIVPHVLDSQSDRHETGPWVRSFEFRFGDGGIEVLSRGSHFYFGVVDTEEPESPAELGTSGLDDNPSGPSLDSLGVVLRSTYGPESIEVNRAGGWALP